MLKSERHRSILTMCEKYGVIKVKSIQDQLNVSEMTIRRDLDELAQNDSLIRIHGGAQSKSFLNDSNFVSASNPTSIQELSHIEKKQVLMEEKNYIAKSAAEMIDSGDTVFLGTGTTIELMTKYLNKPQLRIVTNSLPVFNLLEKRTNLELHLVGGAYRRLTGAFVGSMANEMIEQLSIKKAFIGVNGIKENTVSTFNIEEGKFQQKVLEKAAKRYLVATACKFNHADFYDFFELTKIDGLFTDQSISERVKNHYAQYTQIYT